MNRQPPQSPNGRLDAEERALAAQLPRAHGRTEPGPELDARILAAAHAAIAPKPAPASKRPAVRQRRWILPASVAATVALAAGLSWQLRPPAMRTAPTPATSSAPVAAAEADGAMSVRMIEREVVAPPPPPPPLVVAPPTRRIAPPSPPPAVVAPPTEPARETLDHFDDEATGVLAAEPASPQPAEQIAEAARAPAPAMAKATQAGAISRERASTSANAAAAPRNAAAEAADATTLDTITVVDAEEPDEDVPPATADSPEVRSAWLRRIGELRKQGRIDEAKASFDEFRRRYPDASIPPELRTLED